MRATRTRVRDEPLHLALICPSMHGHLNPMTTLGRELARRGHRVSLVGLPDARAKAETCGFELLPVGVAEHASGRYAAGLARLAELKGIAALRMTERLLREVTLIGLRDIPPAIARAGIDACVVDQVSPEGAAVAEVANLPFVVVCNALAMHQEPSVPPPVFGWKHRTGWTARLRNRLGNRLVELAVAPLVRVVNRYRTANGLPPFRLSDKTLVGLAQVAQQPAFFDFPRTQLPAHFHYTGPWHGPHRDTETAAFPWEKLTGQPLIYASLGTVQNRLHGVFAAILAGCAPLGVQVAVSLGRPDGVWGGAVPANALVVPFAPQLSLLKRASILITHAGLNTALEGLAHGVPMLCVPVTNDQPGVARRVEWLGAGEILKPHRVTAERVRAAVARLLNVERYRKKARYLSNRMAIAPGVGRAADVIEEAFRTGRPVLRGAGTVPPVRPE